MKQLATIILLALFISGCATLTGRDAPNVRVVGLEPLPSEGMEVRFALKLRVQNPNDYALSYDGLSVNLELEGRGLASGVSDVAGQIPRFSDAVIDVPVTISAFSVVRQLLALAQNAQEEGGGLNKPIAYSLSGKLGSSNAGDGVKRFSDKGELGLFRLGEE